MDKAFTDTLGKDAYNSSGERVCTFTAIELNFSFVVDLLHDQWISGRARNPQPRVFTINRASEGFTAYFDQVQEQLETLASMDDLLSGMNISTCT